MSDRESCPEDSWEEEDVLSDNADVQKDADEVAEEGFDDCGPVQEYSRITIGYTYWRGKMTRLPNLNLS